MAHHHFLEVLGLQVVQRLQEVLLHVVVQGVFDVGYLLHRLSRLNHRLRCNTSGGSSSMRSYIENRIIKDLHLKKSRIRHNKIYGTILLCSTKVVNVAEVAKLCMLMPD